MNNSRMKRAVSIVMSVLIFLFSLTGFTPLVVKGSDFNGISVPNEIMLGSFFNSEEDMSDTLYVSFNGKHFYSLGEAYTDMFPNSRLLYCITRDGSISDYNDDAVYKNFTTAEINKYRTMPNCLHDPDIVYYKGYYWMLSGFSPKASDGNGNMFVPMWGHSSDLVNWSNPESGSTTNVKPSLNDMPYGKDSAGRTKDFDAVAPDCFLDENNELYIVVSLGYFASWHGDEPYNDIMSPYLVKVNDLRVNSDNSISASYGNAIPINLPMYCDDRIDGSIFYYDDDANGKANPKYYLTIKRNGVTDEIWSIDRLADVSNPQKWHLVNSDFQIGYEGPCLTKFNGDYYIYTDQLEDGDSKKTGIYVTYSNSIDGCWKVPQAVEFYKKTGSGLSPVPARHGTVITLKYDAGADNTAYNLAVNRFLALYSSSMSIINRNSIIDYNGIFISNGEYYLLQNGVIQRNYETYDEKTDGWYYFDSDGKMVKNKEVTLPVIENGVETGTKVVYYDYNGKMVKGENYRGSYWYYYDLITGAKAVNAFVYLPADDKWVYYDSEGHMVYGEQCINGNWYRFYDYTGKMVKGEYCDSNGNWYYYDDITGIMAHGWTTLPNGNTYHYDEITGIRD